MENQERKNGQRKNRFFHNKDLFTNAATPIFCIFICIGIYLTASNAMEFSVGKNHQYSFLNQIVNMN